MAGHWDKTGSVVQTADKGVQFFEGGPFRPYNFLCLVSPFDKLLLREGYGECPCVEVPTGAISAVSFIIDTSASRGSGEQS